MNTEIKTKVRNIEHLKELLSDGEDHDFFISIAGGLVRSSKTIQLIGKGKKFWIHNDIDGSTQTLTEKEMKQTNSFKTNIGKAIEQGAFYHSEWTG